MNTQPHFARHTKCAIAFTTGRQKMRDSSIRRPVPTLAGAMVLPAMLLFSSLASAAALTWDVAPGSVGAGNRTITGGTGTWNLTNGNWTANGGATNVAWANTNVAEAIFGSIGAAGVTIDTGTGVTANKLTLNVNGYTIDGNVAADVITLAGTTPTIALPSINNYAKISAIVAGSAGLNKTGPGGLELSGANTYTGGTNLIGGTLSLGSSGAIGITSTITFLGGALQFSASNTTDYSSRLEAYADCRIDTNGQNVTFASPLTVYAGLTKLGGGSLVLTSANTYSGGTNVNAGRLLVNNTSSSGTGADAVTVNSGGTLGGTGSISGAVTVNSGGHVAPGASIESLAVGSLLLNTGSILDFELGAPGSPGITSDLINVTASGGLTLSGGSVLLTNAGGLAAGTYTLIYYVGTLGGALANLGTPTGPAGFSYALLNNASNTSIDLTVTATALAGDYNHNGVVDAADYVVWRKNPGGFVADAYTTWRLHLGQPPGSGAGEIASAAVPEPATLVLLTFAAGGWCLRRRNCI